MKKDSNGGLRRHLTYANMMSTLAVFLVVAGGSALAVTLPANSVTSKTVKNNNLRSVDLKDGKAVRSADVADGSLTGDDVGDGSLSGGDVGDGSLSGADVGDDTLTGVDIAEATLGQVPTAGNAVNALNATNADRLGGKLPSGYLSRSIYKLESSIEGGTVLGDGTHFIDQACFVGDVLLSGGPANIGAKTTLLESFLTPGTTNSWRARINKNGEADNFSVVVLCANQ